MVAKNFSAILKTMKSRWQSRSCTRKLVKSASGAILNHMRGVSKFVKALSTDGSDNPFLKQGFQLKLAN